MPATPNYPNDYDDADIVEMHLAISCQCQHVSVSFENNFDVRGDYSTEVNACTGDSVCIHLGLEEVLVHSKLLKSQVFNIRVFDWGFQEKIKNA